MEYITFLPKEISKSLLEDFVLKSDNLFIPSLSSRINIINYCNKMYENGTCFCCFDNENLIGLVIGYFNQYPQDSFITFVLVLPVYEGLHIGTNLMKNSISFAINLGSKGILLKMLASNSKLLNFYLNLGFKIKNQSFYEGTLIKENSLYLSLK